MICPKFTPAMGKYITPLIKKGVCKMKMTVTGIGQRRQGKSAKGFDYDFTTLYGLTLSKNVHGQKTEEVNVSHINTSVPEININDIIDIEYNKNGYIENISVIKNK